MRKQLLLLSSIILVNFPSFGQIFSISTAKIGTQIIKTNADMVYKNIPLAVAEAQRFIHNSQLLTNVPSNATKQIKSSLVQIYSPNHHDAVLGTGFLIKLPNTQNPNLSKLYIAMPYHIAGEIGNQRGIRSFYKDGSYKDILVTVTNSGAAGWTSPDLSLAEVTQEQLAHGVTPIPIGEPIANQEAFSFGYAAGYPLEAEQFIPMKRDILSLNGFGIIGKRELANNSFYERSLISGYCGSPVLQFQEGMWKAVGLHTGGCIVTSDPNLDNSFAVNLPKAIDKIRNLNETAITFNGVYVGSFEVYERLNAITVFREGNPIYRVELRNFEHSYNDQNSEIALQDFPLQPGDVLQYTISNRRHSPKNRFLTYTIP